MYTEGTVNTIIAGVVAGTVATIVLDCWAIIAKHWFRLPTMNWAMAGRWVGHMPAGVFTHRAIAEAAPVPGERALGWTLHYAIGVAYGVIYYIYLSATGSEANLLSALVLAWLFLAAPWLIMQPGLGVGIFSRNAPKPWFARGNSVLAHTFFGLGLYLGAVLVAAL